MKTELDPGEPETVSEIPLDTAGNYLAYPPGKSQALLANAFHNSIKQDYQYDQIARIPSKTVQFTDSTEMFYENTPGKLLILGMIGLTGNHRDYSFWDYFSHFSVTDR